MRSGVGPFCALIFTNTKVRWFETRNIVKLAIFFLDFLWEIDNWNFERLTLDLTFSFNIGITTFVIILITADMLTMCTPKFLHGNIFVFSEETRKSFGINHFIIDFGIFLQSTMTVIPLRCVDRSISIASYHISSSCEDNLKFISGVSNLSERWQSNGFWMFKVRLYVRLLHNYRIYTHIFVCHFYPCRLTCTSSVFELLERIQTLS